jgi:hypothetical protein
VKGKEKREKGKGEGEGDSNEDRKGREGTEEERKERTTVLDFRHLDSDSVKGRNWRDGR